MHSEWSTHSLDELYEFGSGLSKPREEFGSGFPFLSFKDVFHNIFVPDVLTELVQSTDRERDLCSIKRGDVFLTRTSETIDELGMSSVALRDIADATFNGFTKRLRPRSNTVVPEFAGYLFRSRPFRQQMFGMSSLSTRASLNNEMLARLRVTLPSPAEQNRIGHTLKTLDDKIELNRRMNETLEAIARALFKSWFVDFDPVRAKAEGRDPGLPSAIADLFPSSFEDSEVGAIPGGWNVGTLRELSDKPQYGFTASASKQPIGPKFLRITDINKLPWIEWANVPYCATSEAELAQFSLRYGDIVIARMADPGHGAMIEQDVQAVFASYLIRFRPADESYARFLQYWLRSETYWELVGSRYAGTTRANLNAQVLADFELVVPPVKVVEMFARMIGAIRTRVVANVEESGTLAALRDTLLPKLISGELRVKDAERVVGAADDA